MNRGNYIDTAKYIVCNDRQDQHGNPENTFLLIAEYWSTYLSKETATDLVIAPADVAVMMTLLKIARMQMNAHNQDNIIDGIGYLAIAGELIDEVEGSEEMMNAQ